MFTAIPIISTSKPLVMILEPTRIRLQILANIPIRSMRSRALQTIITRWHLIKRDHISWQSIRSIRIAFLQDPLQRLQRKCTRIVTRTAFARCRWYFDSVATARWIRVRIHSATRTLRWASFQGVLEILVRWHIVEVDNRCLDLRRWWWSNLRYRSVQLSSHWRQIKIRRRFPLSYLEYSKIL